MEQFIYKRREGATFKEEDTEIIAKIIVDIEKKKGIVKPEDLIGEAESKNSSIHHLFEWNESEAARQYRINQARNIINHIEIEVCSISPSNEKVNLVIQSQRAFHNIVNGEERGYVSTINIVRNEDLAKQVLQRLIRQLDGATNELRAFQDYRWVVVLLEGTMIKIKEKVKI